MEYSYDVVCMVYRLNELVLFESENSSSSPLLLLLLSMSERKRKTTHAL